MGDLSEFTSAPQSGIISSNANLRRSAVSIAAIERSVGYLESVPVQRLAEDMTRRSEAVIEMALRAGTGCMKTNLMIGGRLGWASLESLSELRRRFAEHNGIQCRALLPKADFRMTAVAERIYAVDHGIFHNKGRRAVACAERRERIKRSYALRREAGKAHRRIDFKRRAAHHRISDMHQLIALRSSQS